VSPASYVDDLFVIRVTSQTIQQLSTDAIRYRAIIYAKAFGSKAQPMISLANETSWQDHSNGSSVYLNFKQQHQQKRDGNVVKRTFE